MLVIEQQDRDLAKLHATIARVEALRDDSWPIEAQSLWCRLDDALKGDS